MIEKVDATIRDFQNPITKEDIEELLDDKRIEVIRPTAGYIPTRSDLRLLNDFFKIRPEVEFRVNVAGLLQELPDIQLVSEVIPGCFGKNLEELGFVKKLKGIRLVEKDITPLLNYSSSLEKLTLEGKLKKNTEAVLSQLLHLQSLSLISTSISSFACILNAPIMSLYVYGNKPGDPSLLRQLSNLRYIYIKSNSSWTDFEFLADLKKLEFIRLSYCSKITKIPSLDELHNLKQVEFSLCNRLEDIRALYRLPSYCEVLATGKKLSEKRIGYEYAPGYGVQDWCKIGSINLPSEVFKKS